ncbi:MAG: DUF1080 domain-containing protein [Bryobacterales bacterium]|nr:DUF1080 domain-containing protein [Bryobacterales bacterium]
MIFRSLFVLTVTLALLDSDVLAGQAAAKPKVDHSLGYDNTPFLPGQPWRVHDISRPHPPKVTPGSVLGAPPSDAVVLFDGKDLSKWRMTASKGKTAASTWKVANGYFEVDPRGGDLVTRDKFGDCQLHVEWMIPAGERGKGQDAGNSGVMLMSAYEIQVLESFTNVTYADGQAGSIYGQWPPLVNASRKEGEWQSYDIFFEAPVFAAGMVVKPAYITVIHNGVLVQHRKEILGHVVHAKVAVYSPHGEEEPLLLQNHHHEVRYRNIWIRRLKGYDAR